MRWRGFLITAATLPGSLLHSFQAAAQDGIPVAEEMILQLAQPEAIAIEGLFDVEVPTGELHDSFALPEDAALRRRLIQATRLAEQGRDDDAARALGRLAEAIETSDVFVRLDDSGQTLRSLKAEIEHRISTLSPEGRAAYELYFGTPARRMLEEAPHHEQVIQQVADLYLHTAAGAEALYRLAAIHRDRGSFAEAAACLERLRDRCPDAAAAFEPHLSIRLAECRLRSGDTRAAEETITDLGRRTPGLVVKIAGREIRPFDADNREPPLAALGLKTSTPAPSRNVTPHPGEANAPPSIAGEPFLKPRWSAVLASTGREYVASGQSVPDRLPSAFGTIVGDLVLVPTHGGFVAHDLDTGRSLWSYPSTSEHAPIGSPDLASNHLSTDGRSVYFVERWNAPQPVGQVYSSANPFIMQQAARPLFVNVVAEAAPPVPQAETVLTALDVCPPRQGNRLWLVGGATGHDEPSLAGHAFLGPPLVLHGRLYVIAEAAGTTRLVVLDAATGRLNWSLDLGQPAATLGQPASGMTASMRASVGATPTLTGDLLLCPTADGAIVAVELASRSLRWGFRYPRGAADGDLSRWLDGRWLGPAEQRQRWSSHPVTIAGKDRMLFIPPEAAQIYCLSLKTGERLWERPREEFLFVAAADEERTLLAGRTTTLLLKTADGTPVRETSPFPDNAVAAGRGYLRQGGWFQPLSDGSLARIDLANGSITTAAPPGSSPLLGNLLWHEGTLISVGNGFLRRFDDRERLAGEIAERLQADPLDATALVRRADLHAAEGRFVEAIADCRMAYDANPSPATRNALIAALLDGVRQKVPGHATLDAELDTLARQ